MREKEAVLSFIFFYIYFIRQRMKKEQFRERFSPRKEKDTPWKAEKKG